MFANKKKCIVLLFVLFFMFSCSNPFSGDGEKESGTGNIDSYGTGKIEESVMVDTPESELEAVKVLLSEGKMIEVEREYERLVKKYPDNEEIRKWYDMFLTNKNFGSGTESDIDLEDEFKQLNELVSQRKLDEVEKMYKELLEKYPDNPGVKDGYDTFLSNNYGSMEVEKKLNEAKKLVEDGKEKEAEDIYKYLLEKFPEYDGVKKGYEAFLKSGNSEINEELEKVKNIIIDGKVEEAGKIYEELLKKYPEHDGVKKGYEAYKLVLKNQGLGLELEELNNVITNGSDEEIEKMYKDLMEKYPENAGLEDGYKTYETVIKDRDVDGELLKIKDLITEGKYNEVENLYQDLMKRYPEYVGIQEGYKIFRFNMEKEKSGEVN